MFKKWLRENHLLLETNNWNDVPSQAQVLFAAECANKALFIFEQEYPNDNRPRKAVEAAFEYGLTSKPISRRIISDAYSAAYDARLADDFIIVDAVYAAAQAAEATFNIADVKHVIINASQATGLNFDKLKEKVIGKTKFNENWKTTYTLGIAKQIWQNRQLGNLPILADALIDAGCDIDLVNYMINDNEQTLADFFLWNLNLG